MRQCPNRYAFRAGRNLPDKEFRYLRTVIVTAAVYWGFSRELSHASLTFQHRAGVTPYTSPCGLAESCVFDKQSLGPIHCGLISQAPLLANLRGHFAEFLNHSSLAHLRILSLTTCVGFGTGTNIINHRSFSWKHGVRILSCFTQPRHHVSALSVYGFAYTPAFALELESIYSYS